MFKYFHDFDEFRRFKLNILFKKIATLCKQFLYQ